MHTFGTRRFTASLLSCVLMAGTAFGESATPREAVRKVEEAVRLIQEQSEDALHLLRDPDGPFRWKDSYIFVFLLDGTTVVHPDHEGQDVRLLKDVYGTSFGLEFLALARSEVSQGWVEYWWPKPGQKQPALKIAFIKRVPDTYYAVGAGVYDIGYEDLDPDELR